MKKDPIAPFEIMRRAKQRAAENEAEHAGEAGRVVEEELNGGRVPTVVGNGRARKAWWATFDEPLVLRLPRGVAILVFMGVLAMVVTAYWVGSSRGVAQQVAKQRARETQFSQLYGRLRAEPVVLAGEKEQDLVAKDGERLSLLERVLQATGDVVVPKEMDPREDGKNYLVLTMTDRETAVRLIEYMRERQVEAGAFVPSNGGLARRGLVEVIYLRGFESGQMSGEAKRVMQDMKRLGESWRYYNDGKGKNLSDMYYRKFSVGAGPG